MIETISKETFKRINKLNNKKYRDDSSDAFDVLIEGERLISQIIDYGIVIKSIYCRDDKYSQYRDLTKKANSSVYLLTEKQSAQLSETENEQGIYAQIAFKTKAITKYNRLFYLNAVSDPGNLGNIFRTASAFGVDGLILDEQCCDLSNSKVIRASLGAVFAVPVMRVDDNWLFTRKEEIYACVSSSDGCEAVSINDFQEQESPSLFIIGSEAHGVSKNILNLAKKQIYIPMCGEMESLNVSVAFGLFAHKIMMGGDNDG